ncbi:unnamed protein product [Cochlearia groenlandica]
MLGFSPPLTLVPPPFRLERRDESKEICLGVFEKSHRSLAIHRVSRHRNDEISFACSDGALERTHRFPANHRVPCHRNDEISSHLGGMLEKAHRFLAKYRMPHHRSALDRSSDPIFGTMPTVSASVHGSSARPTNRLRIETPSLQDEPINPPPMSKNFTDVPKRRKLSAKGASVSVKDKRKAKVVKPVHTFTSSKSKFACGLDKNQALSESNEPLELREWELNQMPWDCPPRLTAPCIRNVVAAMVATKELGIEMTLHLFNEITLVNENHSLLGTLSICWKQGLRLTSDTSVKFSTSWEKFFFVKVNSAFVLDVDKLYQTKWSPFYWWILRQQKRYFESSEGSLSLDPHTREDIDAMLSLDNLTGVFEDELNAEADAKYKVEEKATDLEAGSPLSPTNSPPLPTSSPPPPAGVPHPLTGTPPPPVGGSESLSRAKRIRTRVVPAEAGVRLEGRVDVAPDSQVFFEETRIEEEGTAGPGLKETGLTGPSSDARTADLAEWVEYPSSFGLPFVGGNGFGYRLSKDN